MPNSNLSKGDFSSWTKRYLQNQIKLCLVFNYYFPNGNYRNYFDYYMLNTFKSLLGNDSSLILTKQFNNFSYNDFEEDKDGPVNNFLQQYYNLLKTYENFSFKNGLDRFIFTFDLACKCYNNNGMLEIREKTGDFFVYKFSGPFIENEGTLKEGHITDAYMGQLIRYISLKQSNYNYNGKEIKKPTHFVWRDAHTNCIAYNDYLWISEINKYKDKTIYFLPTSIGYESSWHDYVKCSINNNKYQRTAIAGVVQMINPKFSEDDELYIKTIGLGFIINTDKLPIKETRYIGSHYNMMKQLKDYDYGIDEYILSSLFIEDKIKKYTIYFNYKLEWETYNLWISYTNVKDYQYYLQTAQIIILNKLNIPKIKKIDVIKMVEKLRISNGSGDKALGFLLSMIPNKYHFMGTLFSYNKDDLIFTSELDVDKITKKYANNNPEIINKLKNINFENLNYFGFKCMDNVIINTTLEWCQRAYIQNVPQDKMYCTPANYYSGFYDETPPSLDIGILRQPSDLKYVIGALDNNKLKLKLNKSDYKIKVENLLFSNAVKKNIINGSIIKPALQSIILNFGDIDTKYGITQGEIIAQDALSVLHLDKMISTKSKILTLLIWKALNYSGYDVPPNWFYINLDNDEYYYKFNEFVKKLANIPGWADYATEVLISDNDDSYTYNDNEFESLKIINKSIKYSQSYKGKDFNKYKMASYIKYLKYKNKYLKLKNIN